MIEPELVRKHIKRLMEVTVSGYTRRSKKGKYYTVAQYERQYNQLSQAIKRVQVQAQNTAYMSGQNKDASNKHERLRKALKRLRAKMDQVNKEYQKRQIFVYDPGPFTGKIGGFKSGR